MTCCVLHASNATLLPSSIGLNQVGRIIVLVIWGAADFSTSCFGGLFICGRKLAFGYSLAFVI